MTITVQSIGEDQPTRTIGRWNGAESVHLLSVEWSGAEMQVVGVLLGDHRTENNVVGLQLAKQARKDLVWNCKALLGRGAHGGRK